MALLSSYSFQILAVLLLSLNIYAAPVIENNGVIYVPDEKRATSSYAPYNSTCPNTPLVRPASGISTGEFNYISARKLIATAALGTWLQKVNSGFSASDLPSVGLTTSGGGLRSLMEGAGVVQAFDSRDSNVGTSGLYQGLVYQAGLSGGGWFLSSLAGNNWPTVSSLKTGLWEAAFQESLFLPGGVTAAANDVLITNDIVAKSAAGFPVTLTDPWGRLLSYQLLYGTDGGVADRLSGLTGLSSFTSHDVPYPIITSIEVAYGQCTPADNAPQMEMHPYEWGSWDSGIAAFTQTAYLGTSLTDGQPTVPGSCIQNYDNLGYILGTSSNLFNEACIMSPSANSSNTVIAELEAFLTEVQAGTFRDEFAVYPNPFFGYPSSSLVSSEPELYIVDGGESNQNNPIWPFIQPARANNISVLIVNDNSADTSDNFPNGTEIYHTYLQASARGLTQVRTDTNFALPIIFHVAANTFYSDAGHSLSFNFRVRRTQQASHLLWLQQQQHAHDHLLAECELHISEQSADVAPRVREERYGWYGRQWSLDWDSEQRSKLANLPGLCHCEEDR